VSVLPDIHAANPEFNFTIPGVYTLVVTASNSEGYMSFASEVHMLDCNDQVGLQKISLEKSVTIYPNPASGEVRILFSSAPKNATLKVMNSLGQRVKEIELSSQAETVVLKEGEVSPGLYPCLLETGGQKTVLKISVVR
jgi:hypothetical protein